MKKVGDQGEESAKRYLCAKGFHWLASNFRTRWAEIDLVMEDGPYLVFVEVKKRRNYLYGPPEEAITSWKMARIEQAAAVFIQMTGRTDKMIRFDVVAIDEKGIRYYPNAFESGGNFYF